MSSVQSGQPNQPVRQFVSTAPFHNDIYYYTTSFNSKTQIETGKLTGTSQNCPAGRILRENGKKLYPGVNPGVPTYMIGVIDSVSGIVGYIDPNAPVFALFSTDRPAVMPDAKDPAPKGKKDVGPPVYTNGSIYAAMNGTIRSTLTASTLKTKNGMFETLETRSLSTIRFGTMNGTFSTLSGKTINASSMNVSTIVYLSKNLYLDNLICSTVTGNSIDTEELTVSSLYGGDLNISTMETNHIDFSTINGGTIFASALTVNEEMADSVTANYMSVSSFFASTVQTPLVTADEIICPSIDGSIIGASTIVASTIVASTLNVSTLDVSTLTCDDALISSIITSTFASAQGEVGNLMFSTLLGGSALISNLTVSTFGSDTISTNYVSIDSTLTVSSIVSENISVSTLHASTIFSEGPIVSHGQIRAMGPTGSRIALNGSASDIDLDIALGPFMYIAGNGDTIVTCSNYSFCDQLYLQTSGTGDIIFSTGFGVSNQTMSKENGMIQFICDGFHMIELSRSNWTYTY